MNTRACIYTFIRDIRQIEKKTVGERESERARERARINVSTSTIFAAPIPSGADDTLTTPITEA